MVTFFFTITICSLHPLLLTEQAANDRGAVDLNTENERSRCRFCSLLRPANMARENGAGMPSFGAKVRQADDASVRFRFIMASFRDARNL